ncbi:hypothetical protein ACFO9E_31725 [Streptomyces maoxianensis]|uniref:DUF3558 domain-containing protein n=1 Tax=Streptomyces maoxianensis TaxID=1459942 RepID=A0ABV9GEE3_9ACTN
MPRIVCMTAAATAIAVAAAGCSDAPEREYTVPKSLCGITVPEESLSPLLPPGKNVTSEEDTPVPDAITTCKLTVDGDQVLSVERERREAGASARDIAVNQVSVQQPKSAANRAIAYADWAAVSVISCREEGNAEEDISTVIKVLKPGKPDESAMKDLITEYTSALKTQDACSGP